MRMKIKTKMKMKMKIKEQRFVFEPTPSSQLVHSNGVDEPCLSCPTVRVVLALVVEHAAPLVVEYLAPEPVLRAV